MSQRDPTPGLDLSKPGTHGCRASAGLRRKTPARPHSGGGRAGGPGPPPSSLSQAGAVPPPPGLGACCSPAAGRAAVAWQRPQVALDSHRCSEADRVPAWSIPSWAHSEPTALFPVGTGHSPRLWGLAQGLPPDLRVPASFPSSTPRHHQVLCLQTVPARLSQGPRAVPCHGAVSTPLQLPTGQGVFLRFLGPLFTQVQTGSGEGWAPFRPVQARLLRIGVRLSGIHSLGDCFSLPSLPAPARQPRDRQGS